MEGIYMYKEFDIPQRTIMTPGPVEAHPKVLRAMSHTILGQFDPAFLAIMNEVKEMIKVPFGTKNEQAFAIDGTSRSGIEAAMIALIQPGDKVLIPAYGRFAYLLAEIAERAQADVVLFEKEWDSPFEQSEIIQKIKEVQPKMVAMVHGETANGQIQAMDQIGAYCQENNHLFLVDMVATYGGVKIEMDNWGVDIGIAGSQKCVSVPSGLSLISFNKRTQDIIESRYQKELGLSKTERNDNFISSNYLDLSQLINYWNDNRINHHTEATTLIYGLHTGLRLMLDEGMENVYKRHELNNQAIIAGIKAMGLGIYGEESTKMATVTPILVPEGVDPDKVKNFLLEHFGVEIAGSFGRLIGKIWRFGNMGFSSRRENVLQVLGAFEAALIYHGADIQAGKAVKAALDVYVDDAK